MAHAEVTPDNVDVVHARLYPVQTKLLDWKFKVGDKARIVMQRRPFQKSYIGKRSEIIFVVAHRTGEWLTSWNLAHQIENITY